jgi:hypothetical protein
VATWEKLLAAEPSNHQFQQRLAVTLTDLAETLDVSGRPTVAVETYQSALAAAERAASGSSAPADAERVEKVKQALAECRARAKQ